MVKKALGRILISGVLGLLVGGIFWGYTRQRRGEVAGTRLSTTVKLVFGGDVMLDRYIRQVGEKRGYDFVMTGLDPIFLDADLVVVNLEGPITDAPSISRNSQIGSAENYVFTFDPKAVGALVRHNIGMVNLGNNHIFNMGTGGVKETIDYLADAEVKYFGDVRGGLVPESEVYEVDGVRVGLVGYNQFSGDRMLDMQSELEKVEQKTDLVVVYAHWGQEYSKQPTRNQVELAHRWVDEGADLVIGSHPHVVQEMEVYDGKEIYYSLGNLVFDQYFDAETRRGMVVVVEYEKAGGKVKTSEYGVSLGLDGRSEVVEKML